MIWQALFQSQISSARSGAHSVTPQQGGSLKPVEIKSTSPSGEIPRAARKQAAPLIQQKWGEERRVVVTVGKKLVLLLGFLEASAPLSLGGFPCSGNLVSSYSAREQPSSPVLLHSWIKSSIPGEETEVPPTLPFSYVH